MEILQCTNSIIISYLFIISLDHHQLWLAYQSPNYVDLDFPVNSVFDFLKEGRLLNLNSTVKFFKTLVQNFGVIQKVYFPWPFQTPLIPEL